MLIRLHPCTSPGLALGADLALRRADPDNPAQLWRYDVFGGLAPAGSTLAVTAVPGALDLGLAPLSRTDPAQRWLLEHDLLRHPATGLVLRPEHFVPVPGSRVLLGTPTGTDTQCWVLEPAPPLLILQGVQPCRTSPSTHRCSSAASCSGSATSTR